MGSFVSCHPPYHNVHRDNTYRVPLDTNLSTS
jgi:hypothetical protein